MRLKKKKGIIFFSIVMMFIVSTIQVDAIKNVLTSNTGMNTIAELFPDENLAKEIAEILYGNQNTSLLVTQEQLLSITNLSVPNRGIQNLSGLEKLVNLDFLSASGNHISDISVLSQLPNLKGFFITEQVITLPEGKVGVATPLTMLDINGRNPEYRFTVGQGTYANGELIWITAGENQLTWISSSSGIFQGTVYQDVDPGHGLVMDNDLGVIHGLNETHMWSYDGDNNWTRGKEGTKFIGKKTVLVAPYDADFVNTPGWLQQDYTYNDRVINRRSLWRATAMMVSYRDIPGPNSYWTWIDYGKPDIDGNFGAWGWERSRWTLIKETPIIVSFEFGN